MFRTCNAAIHVSGTVFVIFLADSKANDVALERREQRNFSFVRTLASFYRKGKIFGKCLFIVF